MDPKTKNVFEEVDWRIRVFDSLSFPTLILRPNREIMTANQRFLSKYNVTLENIVGKTCFNVFYETVEECPLQNCPLPQVMSDKTGHSVLNKVVDELGQERWEERVFSPILDDEGEVKYIMDSVRDVTRIKYLEKELHGTKEFLEKVIASSPSPIMAADRRGWIMVINEAAEALFGYQAQKGVDYNVEDLYPPGLAREIMAKLRDPEYGGRGKLPPTEMVILGADGENIPVELTAAIIYEDERELATMGIFNDLREKRAVEAQLQAARKQVAQTEKMASLGQLAAGVAHEVNNPLTGILFYANLALESLPEDNPLKEHLEFIIEDVHRCKEIVKNLLAYSRQKSPTKAIIQVNDLIEQSLTLIRDQKVFANVKVIRELSEEMMLVQVDKNQLAQVIINLVMNALAAMEEHGELTIGSSRDKRAGLVRITVKDTGCGIPKENLSKLFDPFFTTKEPGKGTGLGLSTVYGIVHEHGGDIRVESTGPEGTVFVVELPLYQTEENSGLLG